MIEYIIILFNFKVLKREKIKFFYLNLAQCKYMMQTFLFQHVYFKKMISNDDIKLCFLSFFSLLKTHSKITFYLLLFFLKI